MGDAGISTAIVATKCDKLKPNEMSVSLEAITKQFELNTPPLAFSAVTGLGKKDLWRIIRSGILGESDGDSSVDGEDDSGDQR